MRSEPMATRPSIQLSHGAEPPAKLRKPVQSKYPFRQMQLGDWFFVPGKTRNTLAPYVSITAKGLGFKMRTQLAYMRQSLEGWKPCEKDYPGAVLGVLVWRIE